MASNHFSVSSIELQKELLSTVTGSKIMPLMYGRDHQLCLVNQVQYLVIKEPPKQGIMYN